ncbi:MAG: DMT family transporter [Rhodobacteraceae bacterium]|nr:DMT family transporter [Paracoccaceae bacterium]
MTPQKNMSGQAWAELVTLSVIWGGSFLAVEFALRELPVFTIVAHRVFWAMLILWLVVAFRRLPLPRRPGIWGAFLVMGILNNALPFTLLTYGQVFIESGLTSILNATTAIFGVLLAAAAFADERLTANKLTGVAFGFAGVLLTIGPSALTGFDPRALAQLAVIAATLSYACAGVWARKTLSGLPSEVSAAGMLSGSSLVMVPLALAVDGAPRFDLSAPVLAAMGFYVLIATALAYLLYYRVLALAGSGNLMLVTLFVPVVAILAGALVLGEQLSPHALAGFALIAAGMVVLDGRLIRRLARLCN